MKDLNHYHDAIKHNCCVIQPKYDGFFAKAVFFGCELTLYSKTGRELYREIIPESFPTAVVLFGEYLIGTQRSLISSIHGQFFAFDFGTNFSLESARSLNYEDFVFSKSDVSKYQTRYQNLKNFVLRRMHSTKLKINLVPSYFLPKLSTDFLDSIHNDYVIKQNFEGLVFRDAQDNLFRWKNSFTKDCMITHCIEGQGKFTNTLGALEVLVLDDTAARMRVGGGFTNQLRDFFWTIYRQEPCNACIEVHGKGIFSSGALRHPNFYRFRLDKMPEAHATTLRKQLVDFGLSELLHEVPALSEQPEHQLA